MAKISELKEMIVNLKMSLVKANIGGNCPYAYYSLPATVNGCDDDDISCDKCKRIFMEQMEKQIRKEIKKL